MKLRPPPPPILAAMFLRVSTEEQAATGMSIETQRKLVLKFAETHNFLIVAEFMEEGISARSSKRFEFQRMLNIALQPHPPFERIIVWEYSRSHRWGLQAFSDVYRLYENGVKIVSVTQELSDDPTAALMQMASYFGNAEATSLVSAAYARRNAKELADRGRVTGRELPGYLWIADPSGRKGMGHYDLDPVLAPIVRRIVGERIGTYPCPDVGYEARAARLNAEGVPYFRGHPWTGDAVRRIEVDPSYMGVRKALRTKTVNGKTVKSSPEEMVDVPVPQLITPEEYALAASRRRPRKIKLDGTSTPHLVALLSGGLLVCGHCGKNFRTSSGSGGKKYYQCATRSARRSSACPSPTLYMAQTDNEIIVEIVARLFNSSESLPMLIRLHELMLSRRGLLESKLNLLRDAVKECSQKKSRILKLIEDGPSLASDPDVAQRLVDLTEQHRIANEEYKQELALHEVLAKRRPTQESVRKFGLLVAETARRGGVEGRELLRGLVRRIVVTKTAVIFEGDYESLERAHSHFLITGGRSDLEGLVSAVIESYSPDDHVRFAEAALAVLPTAHIADLSVPTNGEFGRWQFILPLARFGDGGSESFYSNQSVVDELATTSPHLSWESLPSSIRAFCTSQLAEGRLLHTAVFAVRSRKSMETVIDEVALHRYVAINAGPEGMLFPDWQLDLLSLRLTRQLLAKTPDADPYLVYLLLAVPNYRYRGRSAVSGVTPRKLNTLVDELTVDLNEAQKQSRSSFSFIDHLVARSEVLKKPTAWEFLPDWLREHCDREISADRFVTAKTFARMSNIPLDLIEERVKSGQFLSLSCGPKGALLPVWQLRPAAHKLVHKTLTSNRSASPWEIYTALRWGNTVSGGLPPVFNATWTRVSALAAHLTSHLQRGAYLPTGDWPQRTGASLLGEIYRERVLARGWGADERLHDQIDPDIHTFFHVLRLSRAKPLTAKALPSSVSRYWSQQLELGGLMPIAAYARYAGLTETEVGLKIDRGDLLALNRVLGKKLVPAWQRSEVLGAVTTALLKATPYFGKWEIFLSIVHSGLVNVNDWSVNRKSSQSVEEITSKLLSELEQKYEPAQPAGDAMPFRIGDVSPAYIYDLDDVFDNDPDSINRLNVALYLSLS